MRWRLACAAFPLALLLLMPTVRGWLESRMSLHMALELPLLLLLGWLLAGALPGSGRLAGRIDAQGLLSGAAVSCVLAYWMIPSALDLALLDEGVAAAKYALWLAAGACLQGVGRRAPPLFAAFLLLNAAWMMATAGLLYLEAEQALCVNYLLDDQHAAGWALLAWSALLALRALLQLRPLLRSECGLGALPPPAADRTR